MKKILPCVIGLGYVGLPVFIALKKKFDVVGYDTNKTRIQSLNQKIDVNNEFKKKELIIKNKSIITNSENKIKESNFYIVSVPTPIKTNNKPDLKFIKSAFNSISKYIKKGDIVFLESTVYPGTTEIYCKDILTRKKKFILNKDFFLGYSSERINPGDKYHNIKKIKKVVSIDANSLVIQKVKKVYNAVSNSIVLSKKIKEAELSKLIENTQRDLNISLMNEIMILCNKTKLDYNEVIRLARTKWNFLKFSPGLVGGHCLPVDPFYLSYFASNYNFNTKVTLAGRFTNNAMENFIYNQIVKKIKELKFKSKKKILIAGLTYKSDVSDVRNSLALKIFLKLKKKQYNVVGYDPIISPSNSKQANIINKIKNLKDYKLVVFLVNHKIFEKNLNSFKKSKVPIFNPFSFFNK